ncbi:MAG: hypothetical protein A2W97_16895 [Bacteroidetes bacterium GWE2_40_63]|nr:MAG: hypothetical protein A2W96_09710 [Bacteroidetes bacterium GWD2_40_43]OFX90182.1 MAG: hypothetical protein A2W97_16895 [Bacteroidetes bacterium GWE2_40_63]OFY18671.1 MAG: hypothetical protein A2W88_05370 [Bacteroidetes bacterium GWF2_40_13]HBX85466.1 hypothetical protein [Marinilabiliales bacterium]HCC30998.1 hypothetical protein [Marinilabiliales bacterium]
MIIDPNLKLEASLKGKFIKNHRAGSAYKQYQLKWSRPVLLFWPQMRVRLKGNGLFEYLDLFATFAQNSPAS